MSDSNSTPLGGEPGAAPSQAFAPTAERHFAQPLMLDYKGPEYVGSDEVLAARYRDVSAGLPWSTRGFTIVALPGGQESVLKARGNITAYVRKRASEEGLEVPSELQLSKYHEVPGLTDPIHFRIARWAVPFRVLGFDQTQLEESISEKMGRKMKILFLPDTNNIAQMCGLRLIRPRFADHNPFHRDGWLDMYRKSVNLWIPIENCSSGSSLRVFPGSHRWPESDVKRTPHGAEYGGKKYNVPAVIALDRPDSAIEPLPTFGQALLFSSYLIHGGGENRHLDQTRISCEIRFVGEES